MELGESTGQAAMRETLEEAKARIELIDIYTMLSVPHVNQVHLFFRAKLLDLDFGHGVESLEVALFKEVEIPWDELAFRTISTTLRHYYSDRKENRFRVHTDELYPPPRQPKT